MVAKDLLKQLESLGSEQTRKTYKRHSGYIRKTNDHERAKAAGR